MLKSTHGSQQGCWKSPAFGRKVMGDKNCIFQSTDQEHRTCVDLLLHLTVMTMMYSRKTNSSTNISPHILVQECYDLASRQRTACCQITVLVRCTKTRPPTPHVPAAKYSDRPDIRIIPFLLHSFLSLLVTKHFQFNNSKKKNRQILRSLTSGALLWLSPSIAENI